jgi:hypothetical protein
MLCLLISTLLLIGAPAQDSVSVERYQQLESRIDNLERRVAVQEAKEDYFQSILSGQRWTFGTVVTLFAGLVGVVGFGVFRRYVNRVDETKEEMKEYVKEETGTLRDEIKHLSDLSDSLVTRLDRVERLKGDETMGYQVVSYPGSFMDTLRRIQENLEKENSGTSNDRLVTTQIENLDYSLDELIDAHDGVPISIVERAPEILDEVKEKVDGKESATIEKIIEKIDSGSQEVS